MDRIRLLHERFLFGDRTIPLPERSNMFNLDKIDFTEISQAHLGLLFRNNYNTVEIVARAIEAGRLIGVVRTCIGFAASRNETALDIIKAIYQINPDWAEVAFKAICEYMLTHKSFYDRLLDYQQHLNPLDFPARIIYTLEHSSDIDERNLKLAACLKPILARCPNLPQEPVIPKRT